MPNYDRNNSSKNGRSIFDFLSDLNVTVSFLNEMKEIINWNDDKSQAMDDGNDVSDIRRTVKLFHSVKVSKSVKSLLLTNFDL